MKHSSLFTAAAFAMTAATTSAEADVLAVLTARAAGQGGVAIQSVTVPDLKACFLLAPNALGPTGKSGYAFSTVSCIEEDGSVTGFSCINGNAYCTRLIQPDMPQ